MSRRDARRTWIPCRRCVTNEAASFWTHEWRALIRVPGSANSKLIGCCNGTESGSFAFVRTANVSASSRQLLSYRHPLDQPAFAKVSADDIQKSADRARLIDLCACWRAGNSFPDLPDICGAHAEASRSAALPLGFLIQAYCVFSVAGHAEFRPLASHGTP
jgi:hypothetical protein